MVDRGAIEGAAARIAGRVRVTPVFEVEAGTLGPTAVTLKLESLQVGGSFKARGAFNAALTAGPRPAGLIAASGGNHGIAVAHAARSLDMPAEVFVPDSAPPVKVDRLGELGATVRQAGRDFADALGAMTERQAETGAVLIHAYDQSAVVAGQGTAAREFHNQAPGLTTLLIAVGGGGLIAGFLAWYGRSAKIVAVEPRTSSALAAALGAGRPTDVAVSGVAADSLGARRAGDIAFRLAGESLHRSVLVEDDEITAARRLLWDRCRVAAEPGGAAALAALTSGRYVPEAGERVGVLVCGANG